MLIVRPPGALAKKFRQTHYEHFKISSHWDGLVARTGTAVHRLWFVRLVARPPVARFRSVHERSPDTPVCFSCQRPCGGPCALYRHWTQGVAAEMEAVGRPCTCRPALFIGCEVHSDILAMRMTWPNKAHSVDSMIWRCNVLVLPRIASIVLVQAVLLRTGTQVIA